MKQIAHFFNAQNKKQTLLNIVYCIFVFALLYKLLVEQLFANYQYESWQISEFLINYQGGFVRRGLMGEILLFFTKNFNIDIVWTIKIFCLLCFIAVTVFFVRVFLKKGYSLYILPLCLFLGAGIVGDSWIRKDYLFFCFFIPVLWLYSKHNLSIFVKFLIINILTVAITLCHEVFAFFSFPLLFLLLFNHYKKKGFFASCGISLLYLLPSIVAFLFTLIKSGNLEIAHAIWDSWIPHFDYETKKIGSSVKALALSSSGTFTRHLDINFTYINKNIISFWIWIITIPAIYYIVTNVLLVFRKTKNIFTNDDKTIFSSVLMFQFVCLLPLFTILSCDYIRVIFYWIASSFAILLLVSKDSLKNLFPLWFISIVQRFNNCLINVIHPTKTVLIFLMMFIGISAYFCVMESIYTSTMLYNILWILSKPFI